MPEIEIEKHEVKLKKLFKDAIGRQKKQDKDFCSYIRVRAKTADGLCSPWGELQVTMPRDKSTNNVLFWRLIERFPLLERLLDISS